MSDRAPVVIQMHIDVDCDSYVDTVEVDRDEWDAMTREQRVDYADQRVEAFVANHVAWGWHIPDQDDYASIEGGTR